jgi:hypothetical protein
VPELSDEYAWVTEGETQSSKDGGLRADLDKNFKPVTLDELRQIEPQLFENAMGEKMSAVPTRSDWNDFPDTIVNAPLATATGHPDYVAAKAGDIEAAQRLVNDALDDAKVGELAKLIGDENPLMVPVFAIESTGENMIPVAGAVALSKRLSLEMNDNIVQATKVSRSGSDGFHRLANCPAFEGELPKGRAAVIIDDTLTQGGTFASLKGHIESQGGRVIASFALTGKQYSAKLAISSATLAQVRGKYADLEPWWQQEFGYGFDKLTESEARFIAKSGKSVEQIRDSVIAAKQSGGD